MFAEKLPKWMNPETAVVCTIIGAFWWGHILASDGDKAVEKKIDVKIHAQSALISKQNAEIEKLRAETDSLRERVIFLEGRAAGSPAAPAAPAEAASPAPAREAAPRGDDSWKKLAELAPENTENPIDHVYGNEDARFVIYEYLDFDCPYCKKFFKEAKNYVRDSQGGMKLILRQFPLDMHGKSAQIKALVTECSGILRGNKAFWAAAHYAFDADFDAETASEKLGIPLSELNSCLSSEKATEGIMTGMAEGNKLGVTGTPGVVILDTKTMLRHGFAGTPSESDIAGVIGRMMDQEQINDKIRRQKQQGR